jgi:hypothetical protein
MTIRARVVSAWFGGVLALAVGAGCNCPMFQKSESTGTTTTAAYKCSACGESSDAAKDCCGKPMEKMGG